MKQKIPRDRDSDFFYPIHRICCFHPDKQGFYYDPARIGDLCIRLCAFPQKKTRTCWGSRKYIL